MTRVILLTLVSLLAFSQVSTANATVASSYVPSAAPVGAATLRYLLFDVYQATLFAKDGRLSPGQPFALSLDYLRNLKGDAIAKRSIEEIRGQGFDDEAALARWGEKLKQIIPDVSKGTNITGVYDAEKVTRFYRDGKAIGQIKEPEFGVRFFDIWLGQKSSQPKLRDQLIGVSK